MKLVQRMLSVMVGAALCSSALAVHAAEFKDVLDTPAASTPLAAHALMNGLSFAGKNVVAVGQRGFILTSADGGANWQQAKVPLSADLVAVHFPTANQGWAVGHDGVVLNSSDGGTSWERQLDGRQVNRIVLDHFKQLAAQKPDDKNLAQILADAERSQADGPDKPFLDVWFENERVGYVVGAFNLILRTEDGGKTWVPMHDRVENPSAFHLYAVRPVGEDLYITGEQGLVLKLDRTSGKFNAIKTPYNGTYFGIVGKPGAVLAYGLRGNVYRSTDGGANWNKVEIGIPLSITSASVAPDGRIVMVSQGGHVLVSNDDGASFSPVRAPAMPATAVLAGKGQVVIAGMRGMRTLSLQNN